MLKATQVNTPSNMFNHSPLNATTEGNFLLAARQRWDTLKQRNSEFREYQRKIHAMAVVQDEAIKALRANMPTLIENYELGDVIYNLHPTNLLKTRLDQAKCLDRMYCENIPRCQAIDTEMKILTKILNNQDLSVDECQFLQHAVDYVMNRFNVDHYFSSQVCSEEKSEFFSTYNKDIAKLSSPDNTLRPL